MREGWIKATAEKEVQGWRVIYSIEVGRWEGIFSFTYYADIYNSESILNIPITTVSALTKRGAIKRALREIRKIEPHSHPSSTIYTYDVETQYLRMEQ